MGKVKDQKSEVTNAFARMNYLFQASILAARTVPNTILASYYGRLMKEVSKKVVEKIHPEIKRNLCVSCSHPLFTGLDNADFKVKPNIKAKNKKKKKLKDFSKCKQKNKEKVQNYKTKTETINFKNNDTDVKKKKNSKPNKLIWHCNKCGFCRTFMQYPSHLLWIDKCNNYDNSKKPLS